MSHAPLLVTVFSDASFLDGVAGWHYWFKSSRVQGSASGSAENVENICHAELLGLMDGVRAAAEAHAELEVNEPLAWVLQCDSTQALGVLLTLAKARIASTSPIKFPAVKKILPQQRFTAVGLRAYAGQKSNIYLKHVRGHTQHGDARHSLNRLNDGKARSAMREAIKHRNTQQP